MLLCVVAVGAEGRVTRGRRAVAVAREGLGKLARRRGRVRLGGVIDRGYCVVGSVSRARGKAGRGESSQGMERGPRNLIMGVRSAWAAACRRALVANIVCSWSGICSSLEAERRAWIDERAVRWAEAGSSAV